MKNVYNCDDISKFCITIHFHFIKWVVCYVKPLLAKFCTDITKNCVKIRSLLLSKAYNYQGKKNIKAKQICEIEFILVLLC